MDTRSFTLARLMLVTALAGLASPAIAEPRPSLNVALHVCNDPDIQANLVDRAKAEMSRIYRDVGVDIAWIGETPTATGADGLQPLASSDRHLTLVILCRELTEEVTTEETALGAAVGTREYRGRMAYIFYDRVERVAQTHLNTSREPGTDDMYAVIVLAHAMAHEMGHLLLPYGHSPTGLMRAEWDAKDLARIADTPSSPSN
jgi:hypothetical protein